MGETIKSLYETKINSRGVFPRRAVLESCETIHLHYRWLRIEMEKEEFKKLLSLFNKSQKRYSELGEPEVSGHEELGKEVLPNLVDRKMSIELCKNLYIPSANTGGIDSEFFIDPVYIHIHWDNLRLEMSIPEFMSISTAFAEAQKKLVSEVPGDIKDAFNKIKDLNYVVLRNYEALPDSVDVGEHSDLDLMVHESHKEILIELLKLEKVHPSDPYRTQYQLDVIDSNGNLNFIYVDVRTNMDNYYPQYLSNRLLENRTALRGFYVPSRIDYVQGLLYHCVYHKSVVNDDYVTKIHENTDDALLKGLIKTKDLIALAIYLKSLDIHFVKPFDYSVYRIEPIKLILTKVSGFHGFAIRLKQKMKFIKKIPVIGNLSIKIYRKIRDKYVQTKV